MKTKIVIIILLILNFLALSFWGIQRQYRYDYKTIFLQEGLRPLADCCMSWAFGDDFYTMLIKDSPKKWNELHSDIFIMEDTDYYIPIMKRIVNECKKRGVCK